MIVAVLLFGCSKRIVRFEDFPAGKDLDRSPETANYVAYGNTLEIRPENQFGFYLASVEIEVIGGNVYLYPGNISSRGPDCVTVDFSDPKIPRDWQKRLFWIVNEAVYIFGKERVIYRKKIEQIEERPHHANRLTMRWSERLAALVPHAP